MASSITSTATGAMPLPATTHREFRRSSWFQQRLQHISRAAVVVAVGIWVF